MGVISQTSWYHKLVYVNTNSQESASSHVTAGFAGRFAPTVTHLAQMPVVLYGIAASAESVPYLYFHPQALIEVKMAGNAFAQPNASAIVVSGLEQIRMAAGRDSGGNDVSAHANRGLLTNDEDTDGTALLVLGP